MKYIPHFLKISDKSEFINKIERLRDECHDLNNYDIK